ncbi:MAG: DsbA family protein [Gammaproteobacteria bacterium]|nr:DsbA family protein [Gammaproteobacteria bacterium]
MNKREQQRKIKEQKQQQARQREHTRKLLFKVATFGVAPLLLFLVIYTMFSQGPVYSPIELATDDHIRGNIDNPISIVVYADFQCPACATEFEDMNRLWPQISDKAFMVFRHYPITTVHGNTWTASLYAEAAARQDGFWAMHDYLFQTQRAWTNLSSSEAEAQFDSYALELNLELDQLHADLELEAVTTKVRNDQRGGNASGVRSAPAVFINGRQLNRPTRERIREVVNEEYAELSGD